MENETRKQTDTEWEETYHSRVQRRQTAAFVQAKAQLAPDWRLDAGLRHERTQLTVTEDGTELSRSSRGVWLPSATLAWL